MSSRGWKKNGVVGRRRAELCCATLGAESDAGRSLLGSGFEPEGRPEQETLSPTQLHRCVRGAAIRGWLAAKERDLDDVRASMLRMQVLTAELVKRCPGLEDAHVTFDDRDPYVVADAGPELGPVEPSGAGSRIAGMAIALLDLGESSSRSVTPKRGKKRRREVDHPWLPWPGVTGAPGDPGDPGVPGEGSVPAGAMSG